MIFFNFWDSYFSSYGEFGEFSLTFTAAVSAVAVFTKKAARRRGLWTSLALLQRAAYASGPTLTDRRHDEQRGSPYDAKCNVAEIDAVNMGEIGAVRKRSR